MHGRPATSSPAPVRPELLAELVAEAPVALAVVAADGRVVVANDAVAAMVGRPRERLLGRLPQDVVPDLPRSLLLEAEAVRATGQQRRGLPVSVGGRAFECDLFRLPGGAVACLVAEVTDQRRLEAERTAALTRLALTSRASEVLATSLEPAVVLEHLCDLLVPALADHVYVDLQEEGYRLRRAAIRHADGAPVDPSLERPVGDLSRYAAGHPIRRAVEDGEVVVVTDTRTDGGAIPPTDDTQLLRALRATTVMVLPMVVGGRPVGTVGMFCTTSERHYGPEDVAVAQEVVRRGAVALANARTYAQQRFAAVALQRSLLPARMPAVEGLDVAWRYEPGTLGTQVGGDWVDVVELPGGRIAVVVGDVMGRGLQAAAVMGQLRTAVRTLALQDPPPSDLMTRLDTIVLGLPGQQLVTCVYAVYDPGRDLLTVANAGHLPPLLRRPDGSAEVLHVPLGTPLGVGLGVGAGIGVNVDRTVGAGFSDGPGDGAGDGPGVGASLGGGAGEGQREQADVPFPPGAVLALVTDGLVERRGEDLEVNLATLALAMEPPGGVARTGTGVEEVASRLLAAAPEQGAGYEDDVALLVVRAAPPADAARSRSLPALPSSVSAARRFLEEVLEVWGVGPEEDLAMTAELLVSEVVTNAVRYAAAGDADLLLRRSGVDGAGRWHTLWVEVVDADTRQPRLRQAALYDEGGRGLALVQALSAGWGSRPTPDGKAVWFRLAR